MLRFESWPPSTGEVELTPDVFVVEGDRAPRHWFEIGRNVCTLLYSNNPAFSTGAILDDLTQQVPEDYKDRFEDGIREGIVLWSKTRQQNFIPFSSDL